VFGKSLLVAFDAASVSVAILGRGPRRRRLLGFRRVALQPGALAPSPAGPNVVRREEVREALSQALEGAAPAGGPATLVLPDGVARLAMIEAPSGSDPRDYVRFRLATSLPWPATEAIVDFLSVRQGRVVGAAVRRATVAQYEQLAASAGLAVERVTLAPLLALGALLGRRGRRGPNAVHALLGDVAFCLALIRDGDLAALRCRRRDRSEGEGLRLLAEAARTARQAPDENGDEDGAVPLVVTGSGASPLRESLGQAVGGGGLEDPGEWPESVEAAWLGGALA
jgi:hypothetical protein